MGCGDSQKDSKVHGVGILKTWSWSQDVSNKFLFGYPHLNHEICFLKSATFHVSFSIFVVGNGHGIRNFGFHWEFGVGGQHLLMDKNLLWELVFSPRYLGWDASWPPDCQPGWWWRGLANQDGGIIFVDRYGGDPNLEKTLYLSYWHPGEKLISHHKISWYTPKRFSMATKKCPPPPRRFGDFHLGKRHFEVLC